MPERWGSKETILLDIEAGRYYGPDSVESYSWGLLRDPVAVPEIIDALLVSIDVTPEECTREVFAFLERLHADRLLRTQEATGEAVGTAA